MKYQLKLESPLVSPDLPNFSSTSLLPDADFPISIDADGSVLSRYGSAYWDLSPYLGRRVRLRFGDASQHKRGLRFSAGNAGIFRRATFYYLYGPRPVLSAGTVELYHRGLIPLLKLCEENKLIASELHRFPAVYRSLPERLSPNQGRLLLQVLDELFVAREQIGFHILDAAQIRELAKRIPPYESKQHAYIPERIYGSLIGRCHQFLTDYTAHRQGFESLFAHCIDAYISTYGSIPSFHSDESRYRNRNTKTGIAHHGGKNPFGPTGRFGTFANAARNFGVDQVLERWLLPSNTSLASTNIRCFSQYFSAVQFVGQIYLCTFSGMRIGEVSSLRTNCLEIDDDEVLGRAYLLRGETTKTKRDKNALWVTSQTAELAIEAMTSVARMRTRAATLDGRIRASASDIDIPRLRSRSYEPWSATHGTTEEKDRVVLESMADWPIICPNLLNDEAFNITHDDMAQALLLTPNLNVDRFVVGKPWHFSFHQLRRTLNCNAANSGLVTIESLQYQMKHQHRTMTRYYSQGYSELSIDESMRADYLNAMVDALALKAMTLMGEGFTSPLGEDHKKRLVEYLKEKDFKELTKLAKKGRLAIRETPLGVCMRNAPCPFGGFDQFAPCTSCRDALIDRRKRGQLETLERRIAIQVASADPNDHLLLQSLSTQQSALRRALDATVI